ncbi:MAG TPA: hypothetical protein VHN37_09155 [Actinomycetota bacterium]|nr:hypothetical protein [Actinomycetota bacterium]
MSRDRIRRVAAAAALVLVVGGLSASFASVAHADRRPASGHLWREHLKPKAKKAFVRKAGVETRIENVLARQTTPPATDAPRNGDDPTPVPTPAPDDPNDDDALDAALFGWMDAGGWTENWREGLLYAVLGLIGALVTAFFYANEFLPSVGGTAEYGEVAVSVAERQERLDQLRKKREEFAFGGDGEVSSDQVEELNRLYEHELNEQQKERDWMRGEKRRNYLTAVPMYVLLGSAFAVLFATNPLQGVLIGFGWTAIADRAGMKRQAAEKEKHLDKNLERIEKVASEKVQKAEQAKARAALEVHLERENVQALQKAIGQLAGQVQRGVRTESE